jgi:hypothetical protein
MIKIPASQRQVPRKPPTSYRQAVAAPKIA